jgi:hypothetical protein
VKSQITAFILIGILIIAIVWTAIYLSNLFTEKRLEPSIDREQQLNLESVIIKKNIDSCVELLTDQGIQYMSEKGFYFEIPEGGYEYDSDISYWIKDTVNIMPHNFEIVENDLSDYIDDNLIDCVAFREFKKDGWTISRFNTSTSSNINKGENESDITIEVDYTVTVKKENFEREFSNSVYNPNIRFRQMFIKANDFVNNHLLRPDFDINNPIDGYDTEGYMIDYESLDDKTLLFSIADGQSKKLDGRDFTLKFAASFGINSVPRTYNVSGADTRILFSPDRLAVLTLLPGTRSTSNEITITQYEVDSVTKLNTPDGKKKNNIIGYHDITYPTSFPIYHFEPDGTKFSSSAPLTIYLNKDQRKLPSSYSLLYNGHEGWVPYPHKVDIAEGTISTVMYGFSEIAVIDCSTQTEDTVKAEAEQKKSFWKAWVIPIVAVVAFAIAAWFTFGLGSYGGLLWSMNSGAGLLGSSAAWASISSWTGGILGVLTNLAIMGGSYMAFDMTAMADIDAKENTQRFSAICDGDITISKNIKGNGNGECQITRLDANAKPVKVANGEKFPVKAGDMYMISAVVTKMDMFETKVTTECSAKGLISSNGAKTNSPEHVHGISPPIATTGVDTDSTRLVCCIDNEGYCHDNYLNEVCDGKEIKETCALVPECSSGNPLSGKGVFLITDKNKSIVNYGREGDKFTITYYLPSGVNDTIVIAHIRLDGNKIDTLELFDDGKHKDQDASDKYYANVWDSTGFLNGENSGQITWDIEVVYLNENCVTGIMNEIESIGNEETVSSNGYQNSDIDTDSLNQPHVITSRPVSIYHKIDDTWQGGDMGVEWYGVQGGFSQITVDESDNAWISGNYVECAGCRAGNWYARMPNVALSPNPGFQWIFMDWCHEQWNHGFVTHSDVDPYAPDKMYAWGGNQNFLEIDKSQSQSWMGFPYAGRGGEKFTFKIAPVNNAQGIFHTAIGSCTGSQCAGYGNKAQYINSKMSNSVPWFDGLFYPQPQVDAERTYIGLGTDLKNPEVAYLSAPFNGVSINIWDGTQMKYPINGLYVIDNSAIGVSANGAGSQGRIPQGWAPALGGGAFLCWTSSNGIRLKYITHEGESQFGPTIDIGPGAQCAIATDKKGDIHMVYNNGGTRYRKITTTGDETNDLMVGSHNISSACIIDRMTIEDVGSLLLIGKNTDCEPISYFNPNSTLDISFASNRYNNLDQFSADVKNVASRIILTEPFTTHYTQYGMNFYQVDKLFDAKDLTQIRNYATAQCDFNDINTRLTIVLNDDAVECTQNGFVVQLNPMFVFNTTKIGSATVGSVIMDFCKYVEELVFMAPPVATILTQDMITTPSQVDIEFTITDEESPIDYELLFNYITIINGSVSDDLIHKHTLNLPNGDWFIQIKAIDKRGNIGYSNVLSIIMNDTLIVDFSSISPTNIPFNGETTIDLNSYVTDPLNDPIVEWVHEPAFSNCVEFNPPAQITDGQVTLKHIYSTNCQETIRFEAIASNERRASDTIEVIIN